MDLRKAPSRGGLGGGGNASFAQTTMINNKATNDSFLEEEEDDLKGVRDFLRLSDKDEEDEEDDKEKEKATQPDEENENEKDVRSLPDGGVAGRVIISARRGRRYARSRRTGRARWRINGRRTG